MKPEDQIPDLEAIRHLRTTSAQDKRIKAFMSVSDAIFTAAQEGLYSVVIETHPYYTQEIRETLVARGYYIGDVHNSTFVIGWEEL